MNSLHLFAGIGGGILADKILGNRIVGAVEINKYCQAVLKQRQQDGLLEEFPIFGDIKEFTGDEIKERVDVVCGGFPCQDISVAGKGVGIKGENSGLFYELIRVCVHIKPEYIFLENAPAIITRGLKDALYEIDKIGYNAEWGTLSAGACGAVHKRDRWWCLCKRRRNIQEHLVSNGGNPANGNELFLRVAKDVSIADKRTIADVEGLGFSTPNGQHLFATKPPFVISDCGGKDTKSGWWQNEPRVGRMVNGVPHWVDRIKCLGNAQVPVCAALAFYMLYCRINGFEEYFNG